MGFLVSRCQDFETLPVGGKERLVSTLKELERLVMALWTSAPAHASHTQQLSSAQDLADMPHDALNNPGNPNVSECAVQHRDSGGSFAPLQGDFFHHRL